MLASCKFVKSVKANVPSRFRKTSKRFMSSQSPYVHFCGDDPSIANFCVSKDSAFSTSNRTLTASLPAILLTVASLKVETPSSLALPRALAWKSQESSPAKVQTSLSTVLETRATSTRSSARYAATSGHFTHLDRLLGGLLPHWSEIFDEEALLLTVLP